MNKNIFDLGKSIRNGAVNRATAVALAGTMLFSSGAVMKAQAFKLDEPKFSYNDFLGYSNIKVFVNGRFVEFNSDMGYPMVVNGSTYIPAKAVAEAFNANVYWSDVTNRVFISKHGAQLIITPGSDKIEFVPDLSNPFKGRVEKTIGSKAFVTNGKAYLPIRVIFETFGAKVDWVSATKTVVVTSDYNANSQYIDFKDEKVLELKDVDFSKTYSKILYDGVAVSTDYVKILKNCNQYRVIEKDGKLYIFSYQYLMDLNYIYGAHINRKNNLVDRDTAYKLWSVSQDELAFVRELAFLDGYRTSSYDRTVDMDESGYVYSLMSLGSATEYAQVDQIADKIVSKVMGSINDSKKMVEVVNNELCALINVHPIEDGEMFNSPSVYTALVNRDGVCSGYTRAFKYIMDRLGISCVSVSGVIRGSSVPHAWNEVYIDGEWKVVDVYYNDYRGSNKYLLTDINDESWNRLILIREEDRIEADIAKLTLRLNNSSEEADK